MQNCNQKLMIKSLKETKQSPANKQKNTTKNQKSGIPKERIQWVWILGDVMY